MHAIINDIVYTNIEKFNVRLLADTVVEVKFNSLTLLVRNPASIVTRDEGGRETTYGALTEIFEALNSDGLYEFEHITIRP